MCRFLLLLCLALTLTSLTSPPATAHFLTDSQSREIHILPGPDGGELLLRFPATLGFAAALAEPLGADGLVHAPFLTGEHIGDQPVYSVDLTAAAADRAGFAAYLLKDYRFSAEGRDLTPEIRDWTVTEAVWSPGLDGLEAALAQPDSALGALIDTDIALRLALPGLGPTTPLTVEVLTPALALPAELVFDTHVTDHRIAPPVLISAEGLRPDPITISPAPGSALVHWVGEGVGHIIGGLDHVLFVLCLALAAPSLRGLAWSVTGFTLGHSVTLTLGTLGFVPAGGWFIPAVELGVALSIVAMAGLVLARLLAQRAGATRFGLAAGLGLLHGFGFAFMLAPMLGRGQLALPLAGFNIGVELGQLAIVTLVFGLFALLDARASRAAQVGRLGLAGIAATLALVMVLDRSAGLWAALA